MIIILFLLIGKPFLFQIKLIKISFKIYDSFPKILQYMYQDKEVSHYAYAHMID